MKNRLSHRQKAQSQPRVSPQNLAKLLTRSTEQLDDEIVSALRHARMTALQKQRVHEPVFSMSAIGHRAHNLIPHSTQQWVAVTILMAAILFGMTDYWQSMQQDRQGNQLDLEILTSDLPMDVFVDK